MGNRLSFKALVATTEPPFDLENQLPPQDAAIINADKYDRPRNTRPFNKIPNTIKFLFFVIFGLIGILAASRHDGFPFETHPVQMGMIEISSLSVVFFTAAMLIPPPDSPFTFALGLIKMIFLIITLATAMSVLPWPW